MSESELESRIAEIALKEIGKDNLFLGEAMHVFDDPISPFMEIKHPDRKERMRLFIDYYEKNKSKNTKNLIFIEGKPIKSMNLVTEQIAARDYYRFFSSAIEDVMFIGLSSYKEKVQSVIIHGEVYRQLMGTKEFGRLGWINMLGTVSTSIMAVNLTQKRLSHSLETAVLIELMLNNISSQENGCKFSEHDINLGILTGALHDIASTPYSEQGKLAAREELNEENLIGIVLEKSEKLKKIIKDNGLTNREVIDAVQGKGIMGQMVNSKGIDLDTVAYVGRDYCQAEGLLQEITEKIATHEDIFSIYKDIAFINNEFVFTNPRRVAEFLRVRAILYTHIYGNKFNRAKEAFLQRELKKMWGRVLTVENMLSMNDTSFEEVVLKNTKAPYAGDFFNYTPRNCFAECIREYDLSKYSQLKQQFEDGPDGEFVVRLVPGFNPKTKTRVLHEGEVKYFYEAMPNHARLVNNIAKKLKFVGVYRYVPEGMSLKKPIIVHM